MSEENNVHLFEKRNKAGQTHIHSEKAIRGHWDWRSPTQPLKRKFTEN